MEQHFNDRVRLTIEDGIADLVLTRADRHNGMDMPMLAAVLAATRALRRRRDVRCAILRGDGPSFCAGLDIKSVMARPLLAAMLYARLWSPLRNDFQRWSLSLRRLPFPVIAAIHGNCFGAGMQLALGADFRIATADARLSIMEAKWGMIPDMGGTVLLRELMPIDVVKELTMTGRVIGGDEAKAIGLVTHLADDPYEAARALAGEMATRSPDSVAASKFLLQQAWNDDEAGALAAERRYQRRVLGRRNQRLAVARNLKQDTTPFAPLSVRR